MTKEKQPADIVSILSARPSWFVHYGTTIVVAGLLLIAGMVCMLPYRFSKKVLVRTGSGQPEKGTNSKVRGQVVLTFSEPFPVKTGYRLEFGGRVDQSPQQFFIKAVSPVAGSEGKSWVVLLEAADGALSSAESAALNGLTMILKGRDLLLPYLLS